MLLEVNPNALYEKTKNGETLLDLAKVTATKSHPNYALIEELNRHLTAAFQVPAEASPYEPHPYPPAPVSHMFYPTGFAASPSTPAMLSEESDASTRGRLDSGDSAKAWAEHLGNEYQYDNNNNNNNVTIHNMASGKKRSSRKRKLNENNASEALLLLSRDKHFQDILDDDGNEGPPMQIARV